VQRLNKTAVRHRLVIAVSSRDDTTAQAIEWSASLRSRDWFDDVIAGAPAAARRDLAEPASDGALVAAGQVRARQGHYRQQAQ